MRSYNEGKHIGDIIREQNIRLKGADAATRGGFTQVPNFILKHSKITIGAKLTYSMLLSYAWNNDFCFPGQDRLAEDMGVVRQSANAYVKELENKGFLKITRKGQGRPNLYELSLTVGSKR